MQLKLTPKHRTSVQVDGNLLKELKELKKYPRETYADVLRRLMNKKKVKMQIKDVVDKAKKEVK